MEPISVLVVDSDAHSLQSTLTLLAGKDKLRVVDTAQSGYEAIAKAYACHPGVILLEIDMETSHAGLLALREIRSYLKQCRAVVYSSIRAPEVVCSAFAAGAVNYLFKPATSPVLSRAIIRASSGVGAISADSSEILLNDYRRLYHLQSQMSELLKIAMSLTVSEVDILRLLVNGMQPSEIERIRFIEHSTMKSHVAHIIRKFGLESISQVVEFLRITHFFELLDD